MALATFIQLTSAIINDEIDDKVDDDDGEVSDTDHCLGIVATLSRDCVDQQRGGGGDVTLALH